jgi:5-methylthioribose kinase
MAVPTGLKEPAGRDLFDALRIGPYYRTTAARVPHLAPALLRLIADSARASGPVLVHGDLNPKNVLVTSARPVLLDWEIAHAGDPAFDLGMVTAHLLLKACRSGVGPGALTAAVRTVWRTYHGPADPHLAVRHAGAIMAARVHGKSPVDYLPGDGDVARVMVVAGAALADPTPTMDDWLQRIAAPSG